jgi:FtsP/CotA-like multicopper oxidase with cupredoxin domain
LGTAVQQFVNPSGVPRHKEDFMNPITRRCLLVGIGASGVAATAGFGTGASPAEAAEPQPLRIPELIDAKRQGNAISLTTRTGRTTFGLGRASATLGFNGGYLGPTLRLHRGDEVEIAVSNTIPEATAVHWHGLLTPAEADGGPHQAIAPDATWRPRMKIDQPAATLWYHAHLHGQTARQVYGGLAGMVLVADEAERALGLPSTYGVDDLPLIVQDKAFEDGHLVYPRHPMFLMHGMRGDTILVNGTPNAVARVPRGLARLRLVNGSNARVYDLSFSDGRNFHWIASDAGLLEKPVPRRSLRLAPGQRTELLVDFSDGRAVALRSGADPTFGMDAIGMMSGGSLGGPADVVRFTPHGEPTAVHIPDRLVARERLDPAKVSRRRRFVLTMGHTMMGRGGMGMMRGGMGMMGMFGINGRPFDMERVDHTVRLGDTEIWDVSAEMMGHPFHIHGVHFEVLSRAGSRPEIEDDGLRDTVLVREPTELLMRFTQPAARAPFMFHCHTLEHEDAGMMGQFKTTGQAA